MVVARDDVAPLLRLLGGWVEAKTIRQNALQKKWMAAKIHVLCVWG